MACIYDELNKHLVVSPNFVNERHSKHFLNMQKVPQNQNMITVFLLEKKIEMTSAVEVEQLLLL